MFYTHGYGDYGSRYAYVGNYFSKLGIEMAGLDQRGFGDSEGEEGKIVSFDNGVIVGLCWAKWVLNKNKNNKNQIFDIL